MDVACSLLLRGLLDSLHGEVILEFFCYKQPERVFSILAFVIPLMCYFYFLVSRLYEVGNRLVLILEDDISVEFPPVVLRGQRLVLVELPTQGFQKVLSIGARIYFTTQLKLG